MRGKGSPARRRLGRWDAPRCGRCGGGRRWQPPGVRSRSQPGCFASFPPPSRAGLGGGDVVRLPPQRRPRPRRLRALPLVLAPPRARHRPQRLVGEAHGRARGGARGEERVDDKGRRRDPRGTVDPPAPFVVFVPFVAAPSFPSSRGRFRRLRPVPPPVAVVVRLLDLAKDPRHELRGELFRHRAVVKRLSQRGHLAVHPHAGPELNLDAKRLKRVARGDRRAGARLAHAVPEERREDWQRRCDESRVDLRSNNLIG